MGAETTNESSETKTDAEVRASARPDTSGESMTSRDDFESDAVSKPDEPSN